MWFPQSAIFFGLVTVESAHVTFPVRYAFSTAVHEVKNPAS
jgi:hypothetical protein